MTATGWTLGYDESPRATRGGSRCTEGATAYVTPAVRTEPDDLCPVASAAIDAGGSEPPLVGPSPSPGECGGGPIGRERGYQRPRSGDYSATDRQTGPSGVRVSSHPRARPSSSSPSTAYVVGPATSTTS